jgi:hypothetical protein
MVKTRCRYPQQVGISNQEYYRLRYEESKKKGVCPIHAGRPALPGVSMCQECVAYNKNRYVKAKEKGECPNHPNSRVVSGKRLCLKCLTSRRINNLKRKGLCDSELEKARIALNSFNGRCQSCGTTDPGGKGEWCLDHSHNLNTFRGILCVSCNTCLGYARDNPEMLESMSEYLRKSLTAPSTFGTVLQGDNND